MKFRQSRRCAVCAAHEANIAGLQGLVKTLQAVIEQQQAGLQETLARLPQSPLQPVLAEWTPPAPHDIGAELRRLYSDDGLDSVELAEE